jgi:hypothetical protein
MKTSQRVGAAVTCIAAAALTAGCAPAAVEARVMTRDGSARRA